MKYYANKKDYIIECFASIIVGGICLFLIIGLIGLFFWATYFIQNKTPSTKDWFLFIFSCLITVAIFIPYIKQISEARLVSAIEIFNSNINLVTPFSILSLDPRTIKYIKMNITKGLNSIIINTDLKQYTFFARKKYIEEITNELRSICYRSIFIDQNDNEHLPEHFQNSNDIVFIYENYKRYVIKKTLIYFVIFLITIILGAGGLYAFYLWIIGDPKGQINYILLSCIIISIGSLLLFLKYLYEYYKIRSLSKNQSFAEISANNGLTVPNGRWEDGDVAN